MSALDQVLGEFIDAWNAGRRPDVDAYLARVPGEEREELAARLESWLELAPTPRYDAATRADIAAEPALRAALETAGLLRSPLAERLPALRRRADLPVLELARRLVATLDLGRQRRPEQRAAAYLQRVERGELDETRLSKRLLDALAGVLGADRALLAPAPPALAESQAFFRVSEHDRDQGEQVADSIEALSRAAFAPAPEPMDELDRLFLGGPEG